MHSAGHEMRRKKKRLLPFLPILLPTVKDTFCICIFLYPDIFYGSESIHMYTEGYVRIVVGIWIKKKSVTGWFPVFLWLYGKLRANSFSLLLFSCAWHFCDPTPWTVAWQFLSMGFSRQEYWSGLSFPSPGDLPDPGIEPGSPASEADALTSEPPGNSLG